MDLSLKGKTAIVTGAGRGIGAAIALGMARAGANVVVCSRNQDQLDRMAAQIEQLGTKALAIATDMSSPDSVRAMVERTLQTFGHIDVLVSNAAGSSVIAPIEKVPLVDWRALQAVNVEGTVSLLQAAGPHMLERGSGSVIIVSSTLGMNGNPNSSAYGASKAALNHLTKTVAAEWGSRGVRVNGLLPGPTATERVKAVTDDPAKYQAIAALMPLGRWPTGEDMVGPALFLASEAAAFVTGQLLVVDGGLSAVCREAGQAVAARRA
ncbi:SDR family NAD(P)-dependent oxidoreductase [Peristeroidobacter soli]|uniref:SDR family NAD(P)-dependent oxidoreductase n=1 Tax=Peristeroidobacter soli TaxID=2497877 RepID=UPI0013006720|nr:glucose 1-dehydrogenase [Peristeroidobacter soli]